MRPMRSRVKVTERSRVRPGKRTSDDQRALSFNYPLRLTLSWEWDERHEVDASVQSWVRGKLEWQVIEKYGERQNNYGNNHPAIPRISTAIQLSSSLVISWER